MALDYFDLGLLAAFVGIFIGIGIALYIYMGFVYMAIGRKAKLGSPGLAWVPGIGPLIIAFQSSKMHWWPWLLLIGYVIPILGVVAITAFWIFGIVWHWKMFEKINKPGWWAILMLIPVVNLILLGVAAWSKK